MRLWNISTDLNIKHGFARMVKYGSLEHDFIREYCEDNLNNKSEIGRLLQIAECFGSFNFDMLKAIVEEMNRYNESVIDAMTLLNAKLSNDSRISYTINIQVDGIPLNYKEYYFDTTTNYSPLIMDDEHKPIISISCINPLYDDRDDEDGSNENKSNKLNISEQDKLKINLFHGNDEFTLTDDKLLRVEKGGNLVYRFKVQDKTVLIILKKVVNSYSFSFDAF